MSSGVLVGSMAAGLVFANADLGLTVGLLVSVGALIAIVALLAAIGPARRGLTIQATDALRADM